MKPQLILLAVAGSIVSSQAQSFAIDWSTLDGGGGASGGGPFSVHGTIGQPDAGPPMSGGGFSLTGGYWPGVIGGRLGSTPPLAIRHGAFDTVILSWPNASTGYVLEQTPNMNAPGGGWTEVTQPATVVGANKEVTLPVTGQFCIFRLRRL